MPQGTLPPSPLVLVTGATDGIGRETALELARRGARVLAHGRSAERLAAVHAALRAESGHAHPEPLHADLSSLAGARALAEAVAGGEEPVHVLLNNAGIYMNEHRTSREGFELTMAVNHLAPFVLTHALLAGRHGGALRRIVNVSSIAHGRGRVDPADVGLVRTRFDPYGAYAASKLANVLFTVELARRLGPGGPTVNALHPGVVSTKLLTEGFGSRGGDSLQTGAATSVFLCLDPSVATVTGRYFARSKEATPNPAARDAALCRAYYEASATITGTTALAEG